MNQLYDELRRVLLPAYGAAEARAIALLLLEKAYGLTPTDVYMGKGKHFSEAGQAAWENILRRLAAGEPVQYVLGEADFCGHSYRVTPDTLIPRPETEELVQTVVGDLATRGLERAPLCVLDGGTGSGCIAIELALRLPGADVEAWDIAAPTLGVARDNARRLGARVHFAERDLLAAPPAGCHYDVIVSNPPYIAEAERAAMAPHVVAHEPGRALFVPDTDPLRFYRSLARLAVATLAGDGLLAVEINQAYGAAVVALFTAAGLCGAAVRRDRFGNDRIVTARRR